jgi:hypothetical protein
MRWVAKAIVQNALAALPKGVAINSVLQRHGTRSTVLTPERVVEKLSRVVTRHLRHLAEHSARPLGETRVLEVGTGFTPVVPLGLHLAGVRSIHTVDIVELTTPRSVEELLACLRNASRSGLLRERCAWVDAEREAEVCGPQAPPSSLAELLARFGVTYEVGTALDVSLAGGTVDLAVTNNVFEHVPPDVIGGILRESARVGSPDLVASHHIDLRDHYAKFDRQIDVFHNLRFSAWQWRVLNSRLEPQNRLRYPDYRAVFADAGFEIVSEDLRHGKDELLRRTRLAPEFRRYATDDLRVIDMWVAARPAAQR